jgi:GPH family glycoside/pentoside/hexuronide:cation symporter
MSQISSGGILHVLVAALFAGFGFGAANAIPWAMLADVVDVEELNSGKRREGIYSGYLVFLRKFAAAFALFVVTQVLAAAGFKGGTTGSLVVVEQPESALFALRILVGVVPALLLAFAIVFAWRYPLSREAHEQVLQQLAIRRADAAKGS